MSKSYIAKSMDRKRLYETLPERLHLFAKQMPKRPAFILYTTNGKRSMITCLELYEQSLLFAKGLHKMGIEKGDVIAVSLPNSLEWLICHFGVMLVGAVTLGLNCKRSDGEDVKHAILKAGICRALIVNGNSDLDLKIISKFAPMTNNNGLIQDSKIHGLIYLINSGKRCTNYPFEFTDVLLLGQTYEVVLPKLKPDDECIIMLTSGSTGLPKLAPWTHVGVLSFYCSNGGVMNVEQNDVYFNMMPFRSVAGYVFQYLNVGCIWVTIEDLSTAGSVQNLTDNIMSVVNEERCNYALIEGPCLYNMLSEKLELYPQFPFDTVFAGGYPMRSSIANIIGRVTRRLIYNYGSTEMGFYSGKEIKHARDFTDFNCGSPFPDYEIKVVDGYRRVCPRGQNGTIYVRSGLPFRGYINDIESTLNTACDGGWFNTEDLGSISSNGEVIVFGRQTDIIHVGSLNIVPFTIENLIAQHPDVKTVKIIPVPDEITFQQLCACIVKQDKTETSWKEIKDFLISSSHRLNDDEIPRYHIFMKSLPVSITGKLKRNELIEFSVNYLRL